MEHNRCNSGNRWVNFSLLKNIFRLVELSFGTLNLKSLRIIRIFRPLKSINSVKSKQRLILMITGVKNLIQALIKSIPDFANVVIFLVFMFLLFAIFGLHQYKGSFYNACRLNPEPESPSSWAVDLTDHRVCSTSGQGMY